MSHTGTPPDIESISPLAPFVSPILFPTRVRPLLNVRIFSLRATTPLSVVRLHETEFSSILVLVSDPDRAFCALESVKYRLVPSVTREVV